MSPHNLQLYLEAQEIIIRVEGMRAENQTRAVNGEAATYSEDHFQDEAETMRLIMQNVSYD